MSAFMDAVRKKNGNNSTGGSAPGISAPSSSSKTSGSSGGSAFMQAVRARNGTGSFNPAEQNLNVNSLDGLYNRANNFSTYFNGGKYTKEDNDSYRVSINEGLQSINDMMPSYDSKSDEYKKLNTYKSYYENALTSLDRTDVLVGAWDYVGSNRKTDGEENADDKSWMKDITWHDKDTRAAQSTSLQTAIDNLEVEKSHYLSSDPIYQQLEAYQGAYKDALAAVQQRDKFDEQFDRYDDPLREFTYFTQAQDYNRTNEINNNIAMAQNELKDIQAKLPSLGQRVKNYFTQQYDPEAARQEQQLRAREKELETEIAEWQKDLDGITKWQAQIVGENYGAYDPNTDYQQVIDDLTNARKKTSDPTEQAQIDAQLKFLDGYATHQKYMNTDVADLRRQADAIKEQLGGSLLDEKLDDTAKGLAQNLLPSNAVDKWWNNTSLKDNEVANRAKKAVMSAVDNLANPAAGFIRTTQEYLNEQPETNEEMLYAEWTRLNQEANIAERYQTSVRSAEILNDPNLEKYIAEAEKHMQTGEGRDYFTVPPGKQAEGTPEGLKHFIGKRGETYLDNDELNVVKAHLGKMWLGEKDEFTPDDILDAYKETINARAGKAWADSINGIGRGEDGKSGALGTGARWLLQQGAVLGGAAVNYFPNAAGFFTDELKPNTALTYMHQEIREDLGQYGNENILGMGNVSQVISDIGYTTGNMIPMWIVSSLTGGLGAPAAAGAAGAATVGLGAAGQAKQQALREGYSPEQAGVYGALVGASEAGLQYAIGGLTKAGGVGEKALLAKAANIDNAYLRFAAEMSVHQGSEIIEEIAQNKIEPFLRNVIFAEENEIPIWDKEDTYTMLVTYFSTSQLEFGEVYNNTIGNQKLANKIEKAPANSPLELARGYMINKTDALRETLPELALACPEGTEAHELAQQMKDGKIKSNDMNFAALLRAYAKEQRSAEVLDAKLLGAARKYNEINRLAEAQKEADSATAAILDSNPGAAVLNKIQTALKKADGTLTLKDLQTGDEIINQMMSGEALSTAQMKVISGDTKLGRALRSHLLGEGFAVNMPETEVHKAVYEYMDRVRETYKAQEANKKAQYVQAAEDAANKVEVAAATEKAKLPTIASKADITEFHNAQQNAEAAASQKAAVESASGGAVLIADELGVLDAQDVARLTQQIESVDKQLLALQTMKIPSAAQAADVQRLTDMRAKLQTQLDEAKAKFDSKTKVEAEAETESEEAQSQRAAFEEMTGKSPVEKSDERGIIKPKETAPVDVNEQKTALAKELQNLLTEAADNHEISKAASIKKIDPLIQELEQNGPSDELFAKIEKVAEEATNSASHAALMNSLKNWSNTFATVGTEENVNVKESADTAGDLGASGPHTHGDRGWGLRFGGQQLHDGSGGVYSEQRTSSGETRRVVKYSNGKHTVTASEDTELYTEANRPDLHKVGADLKKCGVSNVYFTNKAIALDGVSGRGCFVEYQTPDGRMNFDIWINADSRTAPVESLGKHETFHGLLARVPTGRREAMIREMLGGVMTETEYNEMYGHYENRYREAFEADYRNLAAKIGFEVSQDKLSAYLSSKITPDRIAEEIFCDVASGINAYGAHGAKYTQAMKKVLSTSDFIRATISQYVGASEANKAADSLRAMLSLDEVGSVRNQRGKRYVAALRANFEESHLFDTLDTIFDTKKTLGNKLFTNTKNKTALSEMLSRYLAKQQSTAPDLWKAWQQSNSDEAGETLRFAAASDLMLDLYEGKTSPSFEKYFNEKGFSFYDFVDKANKVIDPEIAWKLGEESTDTTVIHAGNTPDNTDSEGRNLSKKMADYMKNSYVREGFSLDSPLTVLYRVGWTGTDVFAGNGQSWWHNDAAVDSTYNSKRDLDIYDGLGDTAYGRRARAEATKVKNIYFWRLTLDADKGDANNNAKFVHSLSTKTDPTTGVISIGVGAYGEEVWYKSANEAIQAVLATKPEGFNITDTKVKTTTAYGQKYLDITFSTDTSYNDITALFDRSEAEARKNAKAEAKKGQRWRKDVIELDRRESQAAHEARTNTDPWDKSMFRAYGRMESPYIIDAKGETFSRLLDTLSNQSNPHINKNAKHLPSLSTDEVVQLIRDDPFLRTMYDGIIFTNIYDSVSGRGSTYQDESGNVYVFFSPQQIKSVANWDPTDDPRAAWSLPEAEELLEASDAYVPGVSTKAPTEKQSTKYDATHFVKLSEMDNAGRPLKANALAVKDKLLRVKDTPNAPVLNLYTGTKYFGATEFDRGLIFGQDPAKAAAVLGDIRNTYPDFTPKGGAIYAVNDAYVAKTYANNKALGADPQLIQKLAEAEQAAKALSWGPVDVLDGLEVESFDAETGQITDQMEYADLCAEQGWSLTKNPYLDALQQYADAQQQVEFLKQKIMLSSPLVMNSEDFVAEADPDTFDGWVDWMERHRGEVYSALDSNPTSKVERMSFDAFAKQAQARLDSFFDTLDSSLMLAEMAFMKADDAEFSSELMRDLYDDASNYFDTMGEAYEVEEYRRTNGIFSSDVLAKIEETLRNAEESENIFRSRLLAASMREQTASLSAEESQFVKILARAYNDLVGDASLSVRDIDAFKNVLAAPSSDVITFLQEGGYGTQSRMYLSGEAAFMNYAQKLKHTGMRDAEGHSVIDGINNPGIYNYYLAPNNPLVIEFDPSEAPNWNSLGTEWGDSTREIELRAEAAGYDCVILRNITDFGPYEFDTDAVTAPYQTGADIIMIFDENIIVPTEGRAMLSLEEEGPTTEGSNQNYSPANRAEATPEATPTTPSEIQPNNYEPGSFENVVLDMLRGNDFDLAAVNNALNEIYQNRLNEQAAANGVQQPGIIPKNFTPNLKPGEDKVIYNQLDRLIGQFGRLENKNWKAGREIIMPKQQSADRNTRKVMQSAAAAKGTPDYMVPYIDKAVITDLGASYVPVHNQDAMNKAYLTLGQGYDTANRMWDGIASESHIPTSSDIALGELLFMQAAQEGEVNRAMKILADVAAMGTAAGQTVQAMSMIKKLTPAGQLYYLQQAVNRLNKKNEKLITSGRAQALTINDALANAVFNASSQEELDAALEAIKNDLAKQLPVTLKDKWDAWRYLAMLGNPRTHIRNIFGNALFMPARFVKDVLASGMETMFIRDPNKRTKNLGAMLASSAGTAANMFTMRVSAGKQMDLNPYTRFANQDFDVMKSVVAQSGKYHMIDELQERRQVLRPKALEAASRFNTNALEGEDATFLKRAYVSAMAQFLAARKADVSTLMDGSVQSARLLNEARQHATLEAQKATYRDFSATAAALNKMKKIPVIGTLLDGVLPFTKTPINILKRGVEYSPMGLLKSMTADLVKLKQGKLTAAEVIDNIGAGMSGTMIAALGMFLAHMGVAKGAEDDDEKQAAFDALHGQQKYSLEVDGSSYTIDWMAPISLPFFVGVELYDALANDAKIEMTPTNLYQSLMSVAEPILSLSMLDGLATVLSADDYVEGDAAKIATLVSSSAGSYFGQGIPTLLGQIGRTVDGTRHATYIDKNSKVPSDVQYFWQSSVQSKIPGYMSKKMDYVDEWGRRDDGESSFALRALQNLASPGYYREITTTATDDELQRLADATGDTSVLPTKAAKFFTVNSERKDLTAEEYESMQIERGQTAYHLLTTLINDRRYQALSDAEKAKAVSYYYKYANVVAQYHLDNNYNMHGQGVWIEEAERMTDPYERIWEKAWDYIVSDMRKK